LQAVFAVQKKQLSERGETQETTPCMPIADGAKLNALLLIE
jgi:hypothetical protein